MRLPATNRLQLIRMKPYFLRLYRTACPPEVCADKTVPVGQMLNDTYRDLLRRNRWPLRRILLPLSPTLESISTFAYLAPNPKSAYKQLFVKGTRIRARVLYGWFTCEEPMTTEEIAHEFHLPVQAVREAIAYCESNSPELLADYAREEELTQAAGMNEPGYQYHPTPKVLSPQEIARINRL
jgi:uncharacterized protein (DUF433 family)